MKSQDGRYTVARECKVFPYFTINVAPPHVCDGNRGGAMAFFERLKYCQDNRDMLDGMGIYVNGDCGFHVTDEDAASVLLADICAYLLLKGHDLSEVVHEAL